MKRKGLKGFGWKRWSREEIYGKWGLYQDYRIRYLYREGRVGRGADVRSPDLQSDPKGRRSSMITDEKKNLLALHRLQQANQSVSFDKLFDLFVGKFQLPQDSLTINWV